MTDMLLHKAWLETRWRFLIGLALLAILACGAVLEYPATARLLPLAGALPAGNGIVGRAIREAIETQRDYRGFIWYQWVRQNFTQTWTLFSVLLCSGGFLGSTGTLFTMSLPASRTRVLGVRAGAGLAELFVLALVPSLLIPLLSPAVGESYPVVTAIVHALCMFVAGAAFFSFAVLMSTTFADIWRPALISCAVAVGIGLIETVVHEAAPYGIYALMDGESYFRTGSLPWAGLIVSAAVSASLLYVASLNFAQQDF